MKLGAKIILPFTTPQRVCLVRNGFVTMQDYSVALLINK